MKRERKIIVYIATSADGYIARADGSVDWLNRPRTAGDYGMAAFFRSIDTIVWGRKTYDQTVGIGHKGGGYGPKVKNYVFTHRPPESPTPGVEFVNEPVGAFAKRLRAEAGKDIWMMGGGGVIASFLDEDEIDEFSIHVIPTFIGEGIPLIQPRRRLIPLELLSAHPFSDGVVHLHYRVLPQTPGKKTRGKIARKKRS
ncbi:MAG: dihydrofolate reductase [Acidobacteria bacterium]|nr:dihydrofolate reductase [Acidobacteriota bacterium]